MIETLRTRVLALIDDLAGGARDDRRRDSLLCEVLALQSEQVQPYARLCRHRGVLPGTNHATPDAFPALPTDVFRHTRVAAHPPTRDVVVFRTSGTTVGTRGQHALSDLRCYDAAARSFAGHALFPDAPRMRLVILAPHAQEAPDSSLSYMLTRFVDWFGTDDSCFVFHDAALDVAALHAVLEDACRRQQPIALLGTSFAFVHAEDQLGATCWTLPAHSRLMQTGGYKGKSREVQPAELTAALARRFGLDAGWLTQEYGMTELCSQMYESGIRDTVQGHDKATRRLIAPGWVRVTAVDPATLQPVPRGAVGIARIDDLANVDSVCAIQTADRIQEVDDGFVLLGRAPGATPRGCSLAMEEALG